MRKNFTKLAVSAIGLALTVSAFSQNVPASQKVIVVEPGDGTLETAINLDVANGVRINPNRVYQLKAGGAYKMLAPITFGSSTADSTATLIIEGESGGKLPIVYQDPLNGGNAKNNLVYGGLRLKNIFFQVTAQNGSCAELFRQDNTDPKFYAENVMAEGEKTNDLFCFGGRGKLEAYFKNCYFRDNTQFADNPWNYAVFSSGNSVLIDTLWVENCTVANSGLTFFGKTDPVKFCFFDHNTIINVPKYVFFYDEFLEGYFTNNMFINCQWLGESSQMMVSQLGFQIKWGPLPAGVLNEVKYMDTLTWTSRYGSIPKMQDVKYLISNNLQFTSPFLDKYYSGGYGDKDKDGNTVSYPLSYIDWGFSPKPVLPERVVNVPPMFTSKMLDSLIAKYPVGSSGTGFRMDNLVQKDPKMVTVPIKDQTEGDLYAQWARNNFGIPGVTKVSAADIKAYFAFGDMDPTTFPGHKTEDGDGVTSVQDFNEDFSYSENLKSTIDQSHLGSLQWFPGELKNYNSDSALARVKYWYKTGGTYVGVNKVQSNLSVNVYPNPTDGLIKIENPYSGNFSYQILDITGRTLQSKNNISGKTTEVSLAGYTKGIYLVKVSSFGKTFTSTVVLK